MFWIAFVIAYFIHSLQISNVRYVDAFTVPDDANLITGVFMFWIGMIIEKYNQELKKYIFHAIPFIMIALLIIFVKLPFFSLPWKNFLGICIFIILLIMTKKFDGCGFFAKSISFLSKVSYAIYLSHHFILYFMYSRFEMYLISGKRILFSM